MKYPVVHVIWKDAFSKDAWCSVETIQSADHATVETVGFLIRDDKEYVGIASSFSDDDVCCTMLIPKGWIIKKKVLHHVSNGSAKTRH